MTTRVHICGGLGGVGKTTISAAMAVGLAMAGERVVVLTIDPAKRLSDALCLSDLGNEAQRVPLDNCPGTLDALMLDRKATWDEVVKRYSPDPEKARQLLANRYYRAVSTRLTGSHEYMATEKLFQLVSSGDWDVVVVDTPPSQHALEFFRAPGRVRAILEGRVIRTLVEPSGGGGLFSGATRRVAKLVLGLAGKDVVEDISEFFHLFSDLSSGFRERSGAVMELLHSDRTSLFLVTNASAPDRDDALEFLRGVRERRMRFAGFLVNRVHAPSGLSRTLVEADLPGPPAGMDPARWAVLVHALLALPGQADQAAERHANSVAKVTAAASQSHAWTIPERPRGVRTLEGLVAISGHLPPAAKPLA